jgi:hypothetical protein
LRSEPLATLAPRVAAVTAATGAICVPDNLRTTPGETTRTYIRIFEDTALSKSRNDRLDAREVGVALALTGNPCTSSGPQNFFERQTYTNAAAVADLIGLLNKSSAGGALPTNTQLGGTRAKIRLVRGALAGKLAKVPATFDTHVTPDLIDALVDLP